MATTQAAPEQRAVLRGVSWETYERLLADNLDRSSPRLTYDRGTLEIMSPLPQHEWYKRATESLIDEYAVEIGLAVNTGFGSTTYRREDIQRGFEPDGCLYVQNEPRMRGKLTIDPAVDPPPDVIIEIDTTHSSVPKLPIYVQFGIREVWRFDGERMEILVLEGDEYSPRGESVALPGITADALTILLAESASMARTDWLRHVRVWARSLARDE